MSSVIVWDIETVPDIKGFAAANGHSGKSDDEICAAMGDKFPKHIYHSIICIGALVAHQQDGRWMVDALGAPHVGERPEKELISAFVARIAARHLIFPCSGIVPWSTGLRLRDLRPVPISTVTLRMPLISAMSCPRSVPKARRRCTSYVA